MDPTCNISCICTTRNANISKNQPSSGNISQRGTLTYQTISEPLPTDCSIAASATPVESIFNDGHSGLELTVGGIKYLIKGTAPRFVVSRCNPRKYWQLHLYADYGRRTTENNQLHDGISNAERKSQRLNCQKENQISRNKGTLFRRTAFQVGHYYDSGQRDALLGRNQAGRDALSCRWSTVRI
jgi:hypothetical protein